MAAMLIGLTNLVAASDTTGTNDIERVLSGTSPPRETDLSPMNERFTMMAPRVARYTVRVKMQGSCGSGVIISRQGHILTAAHVITSSRARIDVLLEDQRTATAKLIGIDRTADLAVLQMSVDREIPHAVLSRGSSPPAGQWCLATGFPGCGKAAVEPAVRVGRVLRSSRRAVVTDCVLDYGDSGGPLFDLSGRLIGIHSNIGKRLLDNAHVSIRLFWERHDQLFPSDTTRDNGPSQPAATDHASTREAADPRLRRNEFLPRRGSSIEIGRNHETVKSAFRNVILTASDSVVQLVEGERRVALGTIVSTNGYLLSAEKEITDPLDCRLTDGRRFPSRIVGRDSSSGLILLKIDARHLSAVQFATQRVWSAGSLVATPNGSWDIPVAIGIISRSVPSFANMPRTTIAITQRESSQNTGRFGLTGRRAGVSPWIEHDTAVAHQLCGGPVVDITGAVIGINISRARRTVTYAIPGHLALKIVARLKSRDRQPTPAPPR